MVTFAEPPAEDAPHARRLVEIATAFIGTVSAAIETFDTTLNRVPTGHVLSDTLANLCTVTGANAALVVDRQSPMIWGCSEPSLGLRDRPTAARLAAALHEMTNHGVDPMTEAAATEREPSSSVTLEPLRRALRDAEQAAPGGARRLFVAVRALAELPESDGAHPEDGGSPGLASKGFGGIYRVVLAFGEPFSPLRVEGVLRRALPVIERLVLELPPLEPTPKGGRVVPLRRD